MPGWAPRGGVSQCYPEPQETLIPLRQVRALMTPGAGSLSFSARLRPPGVFLSRPQFLDCTKTGWNSVKCTLCVDAVTLALQVGTGLVHAHGYRAPRQLTWQSTIILSLGSSSPAPGRGPGLAEAARLGPRAAQRGVRLRGSWRGLRSSPGPELRGSRQCRSHCLHRASPRRAHGLWGLAARFRRSSRGSGRVGGDSAAPPRPRPARPQVRGAGPGERARGRARPPSLPDAETGDVGLVSTVRRAHVTPPSRAHAPRTDRFTGLVSPVSQASCLRCTPTPAEFRITITGAESGWT